MQSHSDDIPKKEFPVPSRWGNSFLIDFLVVFCLFFIYAGSSVPAINEPHYWTKAAHFWNPDFARGDLFLESGDAHWLFFATFGYLTQCLPMVWAVWMGRFVIWILLSIGWTTLGRSLWSNAAANTKDRSPTPILIASAFALVWLSGLHWGHWAGEWVVGGCESKGIAYAFIFFGIAMAIQRHWFVAWLSLGLAAAFHVVTGIWVIACVACVSFFLDRKAPNGSSRNRGLELQNWIALHRLGWCVCILGILVGAIPAISIDWGTDPKLATESAIKQAYLRLGHHLAPTRFSPERWRAFSIQLVVAAALGCVAIFSQWKPTENATVANQKKPLPSSGFRSLYFRAETLYASLDRGMRYIIGCALFAFAVALVGLMIDMALGKTHTDVAAKFLRFYWFRWNDVAMPMMIAAIVVAFAYGKLVFMPKPACMQVTGWLLLLAPGCILLAYRFESNFNEKIPAGDKAHFVAKSDTESEQVAQYEDWLRVCDWILGNTDPYGLWLTPRRQQSFKWHTGRPELACWKDSPQNAEALVQWGERLADAYKFNEEKILQPWTEEKLWELQKKYGIRYVLIDRRVKNQTPPLLPILYPKQNDTNATFWVFEFPSSPPNESL
jgi:hypothetical protein